MDSISSEQNQTATKEFVSFIDDRFGGTGITAESVAHRSGKKFEFLRILCPSKHWLGLAKWLCFEKGINHCSMITGVHYPENYQYNESQPQINPGNQEKGWEVTTHLMRIPVKNPPVGKAYILRPSNLASDEVPLEIEVNIYLPQTDTPEVDSVQSIWEGADWNEKETWDLVGIKFKDHKKMMRVLNPHDSPAGFHPLQKQHKIRYNDHVEMYDDPQGFGRKPIDVGKTK